MKFNEAIKEATIKALKQNKKNLLFGLEVTNQGAGFIEKFPNQVFETPVSELSSTGLVVGLASRGFKPTIVYGRIEFALLAMDQILTQAGRWEYMFGGNYPCPAKFRIQIGRQWGNGPQHTANYHSIFFQALEFDIFIPSTPKEAYYQILYMSHSSIPSIFLEHRYLNLINQNFKISQKKINIKNSKIYGKKKDDILIITYADTLPITLKAKEILEINNIFPTIMNLSFFPRRNRISKKDIIFINNFSNILFIDSAPFDFGILSGVNSILSMKLKNKNFYKLSSKNMPAPSSPKFMSNYYINKNNIINYVTNILKKKRIKLKKLSFEEEILWPNFTLK